MKRRFTLVTAEEPIPSSDDDEHPNLIATIPPIIDGTHKYALNHALHLLNLYSFFFSSFIPVNFKTVSRILRNYQNN